MASSGRLPQAISKIISSPVTSACQSLIFMAATTTPQLCVARQDLTFKETVARAASKVPSYGQPDIYYPTQWQGEWDTRISLSALLPGENKDYRQCSLFKRFEDMISSSSTPVISCRRVYGEYNGNIVLDRSLSSTNFARALFDDKSIARWDPGDPNILTIARTTGQVKPILL